MSRLASSRSWLIARDDIIASIVIDRDGLQIAYLGVALAHYLDLESGDIIDLPLNAPAPGDESRFRRIPTRTTESEADDRRLFLETLKMPEARERLRSVIADSQAFRAVLSEDRFIERSFFNFKNDQATKAIEEWLKREGLA